MKKLLLILVVCLLPVFAMAIQEPKPKEYCATYCKCSKPWEEEDFLGLGVNTEPRLVNTEPKDSEITFPGPDRHKREVHEEINFEVMNMLCADLCAQMDYMEGVYFENCPNDVPPEPDPEPEPEYVGIACANIPSLEGFTTTQNTCSANEISMTFAPKGNQPFYLHVNLKFENGRDILSTWCTDNESLCKAVGNGKDCGEAAPTGENAWCYKAN